MIVGSLFSGIGGIDLGLERAGMRVAWQCESDEYRRSVLAARFPGVECSTDVHLVGRVPDSQRSGRMQTGMARPPIPPTPRQSAECSIDLICGGFPCQDLSVAGRRAGLNGSRSSLFFEYARIADALLPVGGWVLIENVPGLLSSNGGRDYAVLLATLAELGFHDLAWRVLDSRHFGVPQRRRRVYILARRARGSRACQVLLEPEGCGGDPQTSREVGESVAVASLSGLGSGGPDDNDGQAGRRREDDTNIVTAFASHAGGGGAFHANGISPTLGAHGKAEGGHPPAVAGVGQGVRRLTPTECERLQGFPDGWTEVGGTPDSRRYAALGDAVTVNVAEWIGRRLMEAA